MNRYLKTDSWNIIEEGFEKKNHRASESIFSLGNGRMGQRANFEEMYSGDSLSGSYIAGVYYPDKTRVGWWKNGYPEYFAKVVNSPNWIGINVLIDGEMLDLAKWEISGFSRVLNMKEGTLSRQFIAMSNAKKAKVNCTRFLSMKNQNMGIIKYSIILTESEGVVQMVPYLNGDIHNEDSNYNEIFWDVTASEASPGKAFIQAKTRKTDYEAGFAMRYEVFINDNKVDLKADYSSTEKYADNSFKADLKKGDQLTLIKYVAVVNSLYCSSDEIRNSAEKEAKDAMTTGYEILFSDHVSTWEEIWQHSDIKIEGDTEAQQGIRFNIFHLNQTYRGDDPRLNIGPKGFTGEKYGGSTYWDTEAFCLPFYLSTAPSSVVRNLLLYRFKHLEKAVENAKKLGFSGGAALYPMVTMNGEECHNEWEITFEEIHRNGAIAFAIYNYIRYTGDSQYLIDYGLEVLIAISRFWEQRVNFSNKKKKYVMLGVTGPNEYENNVNNNWYTNTIAVWCLKYTIESIEFVKNKSKERYTEISKKWSFDVTTETKKWKHIIDNMYFPVIEEEGIFMQQDGFTDKELINVKDLSPSERPINQHWSWDRILRSCFIKQADVVMGLFLLEDSFDTETIQRNFEYYEQYTVHESSLSACIHSVVASRIRDIEKAYNLYLRTSRLDIDDYNHEVREGLHITSMGGTWMTIVTGFGGLRVKNDILCFHPLIPKKWKRYSFRINFRGAVIEVIVTKDKVSFTNHSRRNISIKVYEKEYTLEKSLETEMEYSFQK
jgi:maltose phosphorylase